MDKTFFTELIRISGHISEKQQKQVSIKTFLKECRNDSMNALNDKEHTQGMPQYCEAP